MNHVEFSKEILILVGGEKNVSNFTHCITRLRFNVKDKSIVKAEDINKIKKVAVDLLEKIKAKISELDHWTEKQETRDDIETYIGAILWEELPESYSDNEIFAYRQKIYEYVFMRYKEVA